MATGRTSGKWNSSSPLPMGVANGKRLLCYNGDVGRLWTVTISRTGRSTGTNAMGRLSVQWGSGDATHKLLADLNSCVFTIGAKNIAIDIWAEQYNSALGAPDPVGPSLNVAASITPGTPASVSPLFYTTTRRVFNDLGGTYPGVPPFAKAVDILVGEAGGVAAPTGVPLGSKLQLVADSVSYFVPTVRLLDRPYPIADNVISWSNLTSDIADDGQYQLRFHLGI